MPAEGRDAPARVAQHRQVLGVREREYAGEPGMVERELLGAGMQLDAQRALAQAALGLGQRIVVGVQAAERKQPPVGGGGVGEDHVVRRRVAVRLVHGKDDRPGVDVLQRRGELLGRAAVAVGIVGAQVRVGVDRLQAGHVAAQAIEPGKEGASETTRAD